MLTCKKITIEDGHLVFTLSNGMEYDPELKECFTPLWYAHMRDKNWFTEDVESITRGIAPFTYLK